MPWFVYQYHREGDAFIRVIFGEHVMKRFTAYLDPTHLHPWHYYVTEIWGALGRNGVRVLTIAWRAAAGLAHGPGTLDRGAGGPALVLLCRSA